MQTAQKQIISKEDIVSFFETLGLGTHEERENILLLRRITESRRPPEVYYVTRLSNCSEPLAYEGERVEGKDAQLE